MSRLCRLRNASHGDDGQWAYSEIVGLREQVKKLTKELYDLRSRRCEVCRYLEHEREHTGCLREQLAALAEQNERMRNVMRAIAEAVDYYYTEKSADRYCFHEAISLPDLASPILNKYRAEGAPHD